MMNYEYELMSKVIKNIRKYIKDYKLNSSLMLIDMQSCAIEHRAYLICICQCKKFCQEKKIKIIVVVIIKIILKRRFTICR